MAAHPACAGFHNTGAHWTKPHWELLSSWDVYQHQQGDMWESMLCKWSWLQSDSRCNHQGHPCPSWGAEIPLGREWKCTDDDPVQKVHKRPAERGRPATLISCCKRWKEIMNCPLVLLALTFAYWILHIKENFAAVWMDCRLQTVRIFPEDYVGYTMKKYLLSCLFAILVLW